MKSPKPSAAKSLIRVGEGRGFAAEEKIDARRRLVITAAHCLPAIPALRGAREDWAETFQALLGPLGTKASVWAECLFVDPIADVAVLGPPDNQSLSAEAEAYEALLASCTPLKIGGVVGWDQPTPASLIALDRHSIDCAVRSFGGPLWIENLAEPIVGGMSGSPVLDQAGIAIGLVSQSSETHGIVGEGIAPRLTASLPGQFLISLACVRSLNAEDRLTRTRAMTRAAASTG